MRVAMMLTLAALLSACAAAGPAVQTEAQRMWDVNPCPRCST